MPTFGLPGYSPFLGRRQPRSRIFFDQVETVANTLPARWANTASVLSGMCRSSSEATISFIVASSSGVSCAGDVRGQLDRSVRPHSFCARIHAWNLLPKVGDLEAVIIEGDDVGRTAAKPALGGRAWNRNHRVEESRIPHDANRLAQTVIPCAAGPASRRQARGAGG